MRDSVKRLIEKEIQNGELAGASLCVIKDGSILLRQDYGYADLERKRRMPENGIFRLYSLTKTVTAVAAMILLERGELDLYDPVSDYLEGFQNQSILDGKIRVPAKNGVTIQHLLNMTSGIVYPDADPPGIEMDKIFENGIERALRGDGLSTRDFCSGIGRCPLAFEPGTHWRYGASADVLGAVIEAVSGKTFGRFLRDEIFGPLGMRDTDFYVPEEKQDRLVKMYQYQDAEKNLSPYRGNNLLILDGKKQPAFESGGAGLFSTVEDFSKFACMLFDGSYNGSRIIGRKTVEYMRSNQLTEQQLKDYNWPQLCGYGYGNFMRVMTDSVKAGSNGTVGEFGWDGWSGTYMAVDPAENLAILYFIQRIDKDNTALRRKLRAVIYGHLD